MDCSKLTNLIKEKALSLGFDLVAISPVGPFPESQFYRQWLDKGYAGKMGYMHKNAQRRADVSEVVSGAKSVICCGVNYDTHYPYSTEVDDTNRGWISRYAWGDDYHESILQMLQTLNDYCKDISPEKFDSKYYVDTGPVLEKVYSKYSGLGWIGKNTCLINQSVGSWLFLGEIITELELVYDTEAADRCGTCTSCIEACPTDAITKPYVLDATKCISYLTIELKDSIPVEYREGVGNNIYGCDICQDVCPWNNRSHRDERGMNKPEFSPREYLYNPKLSSLADMTPEEFSKLFKGSPIKRTKRRGLIRNVLIAMGNSGNIGFLGSIKSAMEDSEPLIRAAAVWAYWKIAGQDSVPLLSSILKSEKDIVVRDEIVSILSAD